MIQILKKRNTMILLGIVFILFMIIVLPMMSELLFNVTNSNMSPDTSMSFDINGYYNMLEMYGAQGRKYYIVQRWTFDVLWPLVYGLFFVSLILYLSDRLHASRRYFVIPLLGVVFDFIENIIASITMGIYPNRVDFLYYLLRVTSMFKWSFILISSVIIITQVIIIVKKSFHN